MTMTNSRRRKPKVVFFDLETTGFSEPIRPVQIGAVESWGRKKFDQYVYPGKKVERKASEINGCYVKGGRLYRQGEGELQTQNLENGLRSFINWLESLGSKVVLVAHNCRLYDARVLLQNLEELDIPYKHVIMGFSDSLLASKKLFPDAESHKLSKMLEIVGVSESEQDTHHDALEDAADCRVICRRMARMHDLYFLTYIFNRKWYLTMDKQWRITFPDGKPNNEKNSVPTVGYVGYIRAY